MVLVVWRERLCQVWAGVLWCLCVWIGSHVWLWFRGKWNWGTAVVHNTNYNQGYYCSNQNDGNNHNHCDNGEEESGIIVAVVNLSCRLEILYL